jgi:hypothetical protein
MFNKSHKPAPMPEAHKRLVGRYMWVEMGASVYFVSRGGELFASTSPGMQNCQLVAGAMTSNSNFTRPRNRPTSGTLSGHIGHDLGPGSVRT